MTAHINAKAGDFAPTVIMPGDPLRAKFIAENYLMDYREVTNVRNMLGYTGLYFGQPVSVMGHGMGIPSMTLYAHELVHDFNVKRIIRVGSLGGNTTACQNARHYSGSRCRNGLCHKFKT
ncbi:purine nucleoside phosphorylase [Citrobacter freundii]|nr:purine nucleoside phosphorylase [Citrobacter freundii]